MRSMRGGVSGATGNCVVSRWNAVERLSTVKAFLADLI